MKIAICSTYVPFVYGGARNIVEWLSAMLEEAGHRVEIVYLPEIDSPDTLFQQMCGFRWVHLEDADRIICIRPQSHIIPHPHKILWFIHHIRLFYDLWDHPEYNSIPRTRRNLGMRESLMDIDTRAMLEAKAIFTNSQVVSDRIRQFNGLDSEVLYPPVFRPERFSVQEYNDEIVCICRLEHHKRQHLLVEAMAHTKTPVRLRLCGESSGANYLRQLQSQIKRLGVGKRVALEGRWISEEKKVQLFGNCLAAAYLPIDEDSYGYPTIEAALASKACISTTDSGGVLEFVTNQQNGFLVDPDPAQLAQVMDSLYEDQNEARRLGANANAAIDQKNITWSHVLERVLA